MDTKGHLKRAAPLGILGAALFAFVLPLFFNPQLAVAVKAPLPLYEPDELVVKDGSFTKYGEELVAIQAKIEADAAAAAAEAARVAEEARLAEEARVAAAAAQAAEDARIAEENRVNRVRNPMPYDGWYITTRYHAVDDWHANPHGGLDFGNGPSWGWPAMPVAKGEVIYAGSGGALGGCGNYVIVWHPDQNITSVYCHLNSIYVSLHQWVDPDTQLGEIGTTGHSSGVHLHLEIHEGYGLGNRINPEDWLRARGLI